MKNKSQARQFIDAIESERYDRAEDSFNSMFAGEAASRFEQERVRVAKEFLGKRFN